MGLRHPLISLPTRITEKSATLIDNIFTTEVCSDVSSGLIFTSISDHLPVLAIIGDAGANSEKGPQCTMKRRFQATQRTMKRRFLATLKRTQNRIDGARNEEESEGGGAPIAVTQFEPVNPESQIRVDVQRVTHQPEHVGQDHANGE